MKTWKWRGERVRGCYRATAAAQQEQEEGVATRQATPVDISLSLHLACRVEVPFKFCSSLALFFFPTLHMIDKGQRFKNDGFLKAGESWGNKCWREPFCTKISVSLLGYSP